VRRGYRDPAGNQIRAGDRDAFEQLKLANSRVDVRLLV
jgi:hypothetical protein